MSFCRNGNDCFFELCSKQHEEPFCSYKSNCSDFDCKKRHTKFRTRPCENVKKLSECKSIEECKFLHPAREYSISERKITQEELAQLYATLELNSKSRKISSKINEKKNSTKIIIHGKQCKKTLIKLLQALNITVKPSEAKIPKPPKPAPCSSGNLCYNESCIFSHQNGFCVQKNSCPNFYCSNRHTKQRTRICKNLNDCPNIKKCKFLHPNAITKLNFDLSDDKILSFINSLYLPKKTRKFLIVRENDDNDDNDLKSILIEGEDHFEISLLLKNRFTRFASTSSRKIIISDYISSLISSMGLHQFLSHLSISENDGIVKQEQYQNIFMLAIRSPFNNLLQISDKIEAWIAKNDFCHREFEIDANVWDKFNSEIQEFVKISKGMWETCQSKNKLFLRITATTEICNKIKNLIE